MDMKKFSFDSACFDLAEHFLQDEPEEFRDENITNQLAQIIQDAVESWFDHEFAKEEF